MYAKGGHLGVYVCVLVACEKGVLEEGAIQEGVVEEGYSRYK